MPKRRAELRGESWIPSDVADAQAELERIRVESPAEVAALERCWGVLPIIAKAYDDLLSRMDAVDRIGKELTGFGVPLTEDQIDRLTDLRLDVVDVARRLLGSDADPTALGYLSSDLGDRAIVIFAGKRKDDTAIPYLYLYTKVLLGLNDLSPRAHAIAELVYSSNAEFPKKTDDWKTRINTWEHKLKGESKLPTAAVEETIRRRVAEFRARK